MVYVNLDTEVILKDGEMTKRREIVIGRRKE